METTAVEDLFLEAPRTLPVARRCDVLVCGGGPAGVAAAIAAARAGAETHLLELHGCLGGVWTAGTLSWILDPAEKPGLMREVVQELQRRASGTWRPGRKFAADPEVVKLLLEEMCLEAGVTPHLLTRVVAAAGTRATAWPWRSPNPSPGAWPGRRRCSWTPPATATWRRRPAAASTSVTPRPASASR